MFVDASVIVAILALEPGHEEIEKRMAGVEQFLISPIVKFEASVSLARKKALAKAPHVKPSSKLLQQAQDAVDAFIKGIGAQEMAISPEIGRRALDASATYGKVVGHVADLNFGDCFAYACAREFNVPLLYKGNDFAHTDLA